LCNIVALDLKTESKKELSVNLMNMMKQSGISPRVVTSISVRFAVLI